jgi:IclR family acetate operon transcriptional repressor
MTQVAKSCNITVYLSINSGLQTVAIQRVDQTLDFILVRPVSSPVPAYTSAVGKAILAYGPREAVDEVCRAGLESYTPATITSTETLLAELAQIRSQGYAVNRGEYRPDTYGVGVPIFDHSQPIGGLLSPCRFDAMERYTNEVVPVLTKAANLVSEHMGHRPHDA